MREMPSSSADSDLDRAIKSLRSIKIETSPASRSRLARRCAQEVSIAPLTLSERILSIFWLLVPQRSLAMAFGITLLLGVTTVLISDRTAIQAPAPQRDSQVQLVSLHPDASGAITLEWRDGNRRTYRVLKSDNPRDFSKAASFHVRGNRWTDQSSGGGQIAFYRVE
jgi:hypothetical protein